MSRLRTIAHAGRRAAPLALVAALVTGCASVSTTASVGASSMHGMNMGASASGGGVVVGANGSITVNGVHPVPTQLLGSTTWQGMRILADATTPVPFVVYNGTSMQEIKPKNASFHLMVMLSDASTGVAIPYSTVWATISRGGKVVSDERQWPMIARYMGPHYGNDVTVPGKGAYQLSLLVSPPVSARHVEYQDVWLKPHRVNFTFNWTPPQ